MGRAGTVRPVPTGTILLKHIQLLATHTELGEISDAAVYVEGNVIKWVGVTADLPADSQTADLVLDMKHRVVMPGMVNTHHHSEAPLAMHTSVDSSASCSPLVIDMHVLELTRVCSLFSGAGADAVHCSGEQLHRHVTPLQRASEHADPSFSLGLRLPLQEDLLFGWLTALYGGWKHLKVQTASTRRRCTRCKHGAPVLAIPLASSPARY